MQGETEQRQLTLISQLCGSIIPEVWPGVDKLPLYDRLELPKGLKRRVKERLGAYVKDPEAVNLIDNLLCLDPSKRFDADSALNGKFMWVDPAPVDLTKLLSQLTTSMFEYTAQRKGRGGQHGGHHPARGGGAAGGAAPQGQLHDRVF